MWICRRSIWAGDKSTWRSLRPTWAGDKSIGRRHPAMWAGDKSTWIRRPPMWAGDKSMCRSHSAMWADDEIMWVEGHSRRANPLFPGSSPPPHRLPSPTSRLRNGSSVAARAGGRAHRGVAWPRAGDRCQASGKKAGRSANAERGRRHRMNILLCVLQVLAALLYGASGFMKVFRFDQISA
jgi:hypothetical protein